MDYLEDIVLNEISQSQEDRYFWFHLHEVLRVVKFMEAEGKLIARAGGEGVGN